MNIKISEIKELYKETMTIKRGIVKNSFEIKLKDKTIIRHYNSEVLTIEGDNMMLYNADYSVTTKKLVNSYLPANVCLHQQAFEHFISVDGKEYEYKDYMVINISSLDITYN